jgi:hypothetical protein
MVFVMPTRNFLIERQQTLEKAELAFGFLKSYGFTLLEKKMGRSSSFQDGWQLKFASLELIVEVQYYDMELELLFKKGGVSVSYPLLDWKLFQNASGFSGSMFPTEKLGVVIEQIANDIRANYSRILLGDTDSWGKIEELVEDQEQLAEKAHHRYEMERKFCDEIKKVDEAFLRKDFAKVIELLTPLDEVLDYKYSAKLKYAMKKMQ